MAKPDSGFRTPPPNVAGGALFRLVDSDPHTKRAQERADENPEAE